MEDGEKILIGGFFGGVLLWLLSKKNASQSSNTAVPTITITAIDPAAKSITFTMQAGGNSFTDTYFQGDPQQSVTNDNVNYFVSAPTDGSDGPTLSIQQKQPDGSFQTLVSTSIGYDYPQDQLPDVEKES